MYSSGDSVTLTASSLSSAATAAQLPPSAVTLAGFGGLSIVVRRLARRSPCRRAFAAPRPRRSRRSGFGSRRRVRGLLLVPGSRRVAAFAPGSRAFCAFARPTLGRCAPSPRGSRRSYLLCRLALVHCTAAVSRGHWRSGCARALSVHCSRRVPATHFVCPVFSPPSPARRGPGRVCVPAGRSAPLCRRSGRGLSDPRLRRLSAGLLVCVRFFRRGLWRA